MRCFYAFIIIVAGMVQQACAQQREDEVGKFYSFDRPLNVPTQTLGGMQFWSDFQWRGGWRIQQNALSGHWRLLDENAVRRAWGNRENCERELDRLQPKNEIIGKRAVILLHGLGRTSGSMKSLDRFLETAGYSCVLRLEYASSRANIAAHAAALRSVVERLPADTRFDFVGHSMGNIVLRHAWQDWQLAERTDVLERFDHVVMLGPPNQGAMIAKRLSKTGVFRLVAGKGGLELGMNWEELQNHLATPSCPFGIVAGSVGNTNPLVEGPSDFLVAVDETQLEGSRDFLMVPVVHTFLMDDPAVQNAILNFFQREQFAN